MQATICGYDKTIIKLLVGGLQLFLHVISIHVYQPAPSFVLPHFVLPHKKGWVALCLYGNIPGALTEEHPSTLNKVGRA